MGTPTQKRTKSSKLRRASHFGLLKTKLVKCSKCGKPKKPHYACEHCGTYRDKQVIAIKAKRKTVKQKAKERKAKQEEKDTK